MPVNRRSLGVTDAYRRRMLEIRRKGEQMARQTWGDVDPEDLAGTFKVKPLANGIGVLQRTGVLLSQAYVQAFIKSEISKDVLIPTPQGFSGNSFDDVKLRFALWRPVVLVRQLREQGVSEHEAMRRGRDTLLRSVSLATDGAVRDSLQKLYDKQPEIVGWKRAVKGTCDICMGAADGSTLPPGTPLDIHPSCECVSEAVVKQPRANTEHLPAAQKEPVDSAVRVTEFVHKMPEGTKPVMFQMEKQGGDMMAAGRYDCGSNSITISNWAAGKYEGIDTIGNTLHELGHAADMAIGRTKWATDIGFGDTQELMATIRATPAMERLRKSAFYLKGYHDNPQELFARAYAQWIVDKEGIPVDWGTDVKYGIQWSDEEFTPIYNAFDKFFKGRGLLNG